MDAILFLLPLAEWNALEKPLNAEFTAWLVEWAKDEAALPATDDVMRGQRRYGHYLGWRAARRMVAARRVVG